jgi:hypothetical protein
MAPRDSWHVFKAVLILVLGMTIPTPGSAQVGAFEGLLKRITGVALYGEVGMLTRPVQLTSSSYWSREVLGKQGGLRGSGVEFLFDVDTLGRTSDRVEVEVALGYDQVAGFAAQERTLDLRGAIREIPRFSLYASPPGTVLGLDPYFGLSMGFVQLSNAQGYDSTGVQYPVDGSTYELGVSAGLSRALGKHAQRAVLFLEAAYRNRKFDSLKWTIPSPGKLPQGWPRSLDVHTTMFSLGIQYRMFGKGP